MRLFVTGLRCLRLTGHILYALLVACVFPKLGTRCQQWVMQDWSVKLLDILNVKTQAVGTGFKARPHGSLLAANHISWLDIFVINASTPSRFVAKSEVGAWPLLGWLVRQSGTLFIRRQYKRDAFRVHRAIANFIAKGEDVALFPQGTSSDGAAPVRFHSALLQGAIDARAGVQPLAIYYHDGTGRPAMEVAFVGDMTVLHSLWKILCLPTLTVHLTYLPTIACAETTRRELAIRAQDAVNAVLAEHHRRSADSPPPELHGLQAQWGTP